MSAPCSVCRGTGAVRVTGLTETGFRETVTAPCAACRPITVSINPDAAAQQHPKGAPEGCVCRRCRPDLNIAAPPAERGAKPADSGCPWCLLAAEKRRADEAERALGAMVSERFRDDTLQSAAAISSDLRARLATAEAEVGSLRTVALANQNAALDLTKKLEVAEAEVARLRAAYDDPLTDSTDFAHPAWVRGCDRGVRGAAESIERVFEEPLPLVGNVSDEVLERVRQRVAALRDQVARLEGAGDEMDTMLRLGNWGERQRAGWRAAREVK